MESIFQWISGGSYQFLLQIKMLQQIINRMKAPLCFTLQKELLLLHNLSPSSETQQKQHEISDSLLSPFTSEKGKKITRKPESILRRLQVEKPLSFNHVNNVFNMFGINELSIKNKNYEQSFFKSMFYIRTVEKVELRKNAVIAQLKTCDNSPPIEYLINRYRSFGQQQFYSIAQQLQSLKSKFEGESFAKKVKKCFDGEPLSRFIDSMGDSIYMCRVAPNKLVISKKLLQLLGEDPENYAVELCKYKMPLKEIISSETYSAIIAKSLENLGLLCDFINGSLTGDQLHSQTSLQFTDYLYNKQNAKIYCNFVLFMPTPQINCIQVSQVLTEPTDIKTRCDITLKKKSLLQKSCEQLRYNEAQVLKNIIALPKALLKDNSRKVAQYMQIPAKQ